MQKKTTIAYILVSISIFTTTLVFQQAITTRREASVFTIADELDLPASAYDEKIRVAIVNSRGNIAPYDNSWKFIEGNPYGAYQLDFDFDTLRKSNFTFIDIVKSNADVLVISSADVLAYEYTDQQIAAIKTYVRQGHGIIMTGASTSSDVDNNRKLYDLFGINNSILLDYMGYSDGEFSFNLTGLTHPVFQGISKNYDPASNTTAAYPVIATSWADVITNGTLIAQSNTTVNAIEAAIIMYNSTWRGLYFSYDIEKYNAASYVYPDLDDYKLMYNSIVWCAKSPMKLHVNNSSLTRGQSIELTAVIRNSFNVSQQIVNYSLTIFNANNGSIVSSAINTSMAPTTEVSIPWLASLAIPRGTYVFSVMVSTLVESSSKSVLISIINKGPTITLNYLPIEVRDDAGPLVFTAAVTDIDDDPITVTWYLDGNAIGTGTSLSIEGKPAFGLHNITIV
nr:hypothetical protein [Candidatus Sigynarchaeota archaeon]